MASNGVPAPQNGASAGRAAGIPAAPQRRTMSMGHRVSPVIGTIGLGVAISTLVLLGLSLLPYAGTGGPKLWSNMADIQKMAAGLGISFAAGAAAAGYGLRRVPAPAGRDEPQIVSEEGRPPAPAPRDVVEEQAGLGGVPSLARPEPGSEAELAGLKQELTEHLQQHLDPVMSRITSGLTRSGDVTPDDVTPGDVTPRVVTLGELARQSPYFANEPNPAFDIVAHLVAAVRGVVRYKAAEGVGKRGQLAGILLGQLDTAIMLQIRILALQNPEHPSIGQLRQIRRDVLIPSKKGQVEQGPPAEEALPGSSAAELRIELSTLLQSDLNGLLGEAGRKLGEFRRETGSKATSSLLHTGHDTTDLDLAAVAAELTGWQPDPTLGMNANNTRSNALRRLLGNIQEAMDLQARLLELQEAGEPSAAQRVERLHQGRANILAFLDRPKAIPGAEGWMDR